MTWSTLGRIRRLKFLKASPLLLLFVPIYSSVRPMFAEVGYDLPLPVNLVLLYFAALFYYLGCLVFDVRCPRLISENDSVYNYIETCLSHERTCVEHKASIENNIEIIKKRFRDNEDFSEHEDNENAQKLLQEKVRLEEIAELKSTWERNNGDRKVASRSVAALFVFASAISVYLIFCDAPQRVIASLGEDACRVPPFQTPEPTLAQLVLQFLLSCQSPRPATTD